MLFPLIFIVTVALSISFVCSLLEACVLSLSSADVASIEKHSPGIGKVWRGFKLNLQVPLAVILIINTCAHTIGAFLAGVEFENNFGNRYLIGFSVVLSYVMIQWTEILPKTLGANFNRQLAPAIALPLNFLTKLFKPLVLLIQLLNRPFEGRKKIRPLSTMEEIRALAHAALMSKQMGPQVEKIIAASTALSEKSAQQAMVPMDEISFLDADTSLTDAFIRAHLDAHTRYPLCEGNDLNKIVGYINFKELVSVMRTNPENATLRGIARPIWKVRLRDPLSFILRTLVETHQHISIVQSDEGKTMGLITMEDILEELIGDIEDEFDHLPRTFHALGENLYMIGGGCSAADVAKKLNVDLGGASGSISDWITGKLDTLPRPNQTFTYNGVTFTVRRIRRHKVYELVATFSPPSTDRPR